MAEYKFVKVVHVPTLVEEISKAGLAAVVPDVSSAGSIVTCTSSVTLDPTTEERLRRVVLNHRSVLFAQSELVSTISDARLFGVSIIDEFGAENVALKFTPAQVAYVAQRFSAVLTLLITGSLKTALLVIENQPPDPVIPKERMQYYANKIRKYLGMPQL